jgi:long-chain fatty acid transport protein
MGRRFVRSLGCAVLFGALASPLGAQGSSVYNHSACASALGGATIAAPCQDASSVFYNPGALAVQPSTVSAGLNVIYNYGDFTYDTTGTVVDREGAAPIVPHAYLNYRFGKAALALGFWAPYGLGLEWPEDFEGRFVSWKTQLRGLYLQPTLAYELIPGKLAIGAGPQIVFGGIEINQHVDGPVADNTLAALGIPLGTDIAAAKLSGDGTGVGGAFGIYYKPNSRFAIGARYMMAVEVGLEGDAEFDQISNPDIVLRVPGPTGETVTVPLDAQLAPLFEPGGSLADQGAEATIEFPPQAVVGIWFGATPELGLSFDYQWTGWETFDQILAEFDGGADDLPLPLLYENTHSFRSGATYALSPAVEARGGFIYNTAASPDESVTPILPEAERQLYTLGLGWASDAFRADIYYNYVNQADRRGRVRTSTTPPIVSGPEGADLNVGVYSTTAHLVGVTLSYVFGNR